MCDTLVALGNSTEDGSVIFGKNSDRPQEEVQLITYFPRTSYPEGEKLNCTYITIPQVSETAAILLSQPWWMWGAEMGANEYGVVIGNEAVHTREPLRNKGLLGMDLLRLGLERSKNAKTAMNIIIKLLEVYGQGGGCAYNDSSWLYHNSFLIADPKEAYVLETADKWWIAEKVIDIRSISNGLSIREKGELRRKGIIDHAIQRGYCNDDDTFDFASIFSGTHISNTPTPYSRGGKSFLLLRENKGKINSRLMMNFLQEHEAGICMHGGFESTGSQVSHLYDNEGAVHWITGSTLPCLSLYKPYTFSIEQKFVHKPAPYSMINPHWFWCKHSKHVRVFNRSSEPSPKNSYRSSLNTHQNNLIQMVDDAITKKNKSIDTPKIKETVKVINFKAWEIAKKMIT